MTQKPRDLELNFDTRVKITEWTVTPIALIGYSYTLNEALCGSTIPARRVEFRTGFTPALRLAGKLTLNRDYRMIPTSIED